MLGLVKRVRGFPTILDGKIAEEVKSILPHGHHARNFSKLIAMELVGIPVSHSETHKELVRVGIFIEVLEHGKVCSPV